MESWLLTVQYEAGELKLADDAELRILEGMRRTGRVVLQEWADGQLKKLRKRFVKAQRLCAAQVKNFAGTPLLVT